MKKNFNKSERGFTIIEVVLVLAIGGLIFLVVFLALPGLQSSQKDTQRKQVLSSAASAIITYQSNNKGKLPSASVTSTAITTTGLPFKTWMSSEASFQNPSTSEEYNVRYANGSAAGSVLAAADNQAQTYASMEFDTIYYSKGAVCDPSGIVAGSATTTKAAVALKLESGSGACQEL